MFKKDDYIVCLEGDFTTDGGIRSNVVNKNYIIKQLYELNYLHVYKGLDDCELCNDKFTFDKKKKLKDWRLATKEEIGEYDRLGKPYDVTTLKTNYILPKDLIKGNYYVNTWPQGHDYLIKFKKLTNENYFYAYETIKESKIFVSDFNNNIGISTFRNATQDEIDWLDACMKVNKFISLEESKKNPLEDLLEEVKKRYPIGTKFKPAHFGGEKAIIEIISHTFSTCDKSLIVLDRNSIKYLIQDPDVKNCQPCIKENNKWAEIIEKWNNENIASFKEYKIGDKIKLLQSGGNNTGHPKCKKTYDSSDIGSVLIIESFERYNGYIVAFCEEDYVLHIEKYSHYFEKLTEPKVGDWVVITKYESADDIGSIVQVVNIDLNRLDYFSKKHSTLEKKVTRSASLNAIRKAESHEIPNSESYLEIFKESLSNSEFVPETGKYYYVIDKSTSNLRNDKVYKLNAINANAGLRNYHFDEHGENKKNNSCWLRLEDFRLASQQEIETLCNYYQPSLREQLKPENIRPYDDKLLISLYGQYLVFIEENNLLENNLLDIKVNKVKSVSIALIEPDTRLLF